MWPLRSKTVFYLVGYGTQVRQPLSRPQKPQPMSLPLIRRYMTCCNGSPQLAEPLRRHGLGRHTVEMLAQAGHERGAEATGSLS